jgi:hypothetical protein
VLAKCLFEERCRGVSDIEKLCQTAARLGADSTVLSRMLFDNFDPSSIGQITNCLRKCDPLHFLHEFYDIAGGFAAEAVIESTLVIHVKTGRLFLVEGTQAYKASPPPLQSDNLLNNSDQRSLATDSLDRLLPEHSRRGLLQFRTSPRQR